MKFKTIVILANGALLASFAIVFLGPALALNLSSAPGFFIGNFISAGLCLALIAGLNLYFYSRKTLFSFLLAEDWQALAAYFDRLLFIKQKLSLRAIRYYINASIYAAKEPNLKELEELTLKKKPKLMTKCAHIFAMRYLVSKDKDQSDAWFAQALLAPKIAHRDCLLWDKAFAAFSRRLYEEAANDLLALPERPKDDMLALLACYLLNLCQEKLPQNNDLAAAAQKRFEEGARRLALKYPGRAAWQKKQLQSAEKNIQMILLNGVAEQAFAWLYPQGRTRRVQ